MSEQLHQHDVAHERRTRHPWRHRWSTHGPVLSAAPLVGARVLAAAAAAGAQGPTPRPGDEAAAAPAGEIDLPRQRLRAAGLDFAFDIDARAKQSLLAGWDEIERTLQHRDAIAAFEARRLAEHAWLG